MSVKTTWLDLNSAASQKLAVKINEFMEEELKKGDYANLPHPVLAVDALATVMRAIAVSGIDSLDPAHEKK